MQRLRFPPGRTLRPWLGTLIILVALWPLAARATTTLEGLDLSPDITVNLSGPTLNDEDVATDDLLGLVTPLTLGLLPAPSDVTGYHLRASGEDLLVFDTTVSLPGGVIATPQDVVQFDGTTFSRVFVGATVGVPAGARIDALSMIDNDLLLSFDITVALPGLRVTDEDVVRVAGSTFNLFFAGAAAGVPAALDLDALHYLAKSGQLLVSFDGSGVLGGAAFDDEDVLEFDPNTAAWTLIYDGSFEHAGWPPADLDALHATAQAVVEVCNVDGDSNIDRHDITLIMAARNTPANGPDDPRDADGDGRITALDARQCVLQCTNPRCAS